MDFGVEHRDPEPIWGRRVRVGVFDPFDQSVPAESGEVVAHLVHGVGGAEQMVHLGAEAPVGESDGVQGDADGAEQGHDPRVAEPHGWGLPAILSEGGLRDTFSIEQATVDVTRFGLQLVQMDQASATTQIIWRIDHGLDP